MKNGWPGQAIIIGQIIGQAIGDYNFWPIDRPSDWPRAWPIDWHKMQFFTIYSKSTPSNAKAASSSKVDAVSSCLFAHFLSFSMSSMACFKIISIVDLVSSCFLHNFCHLWPPPRHPWPQSIWSLRIFWHFLSSSVSSMASSNGLFKAHFL